MTTKQTFSRREALLFLVGGAIAAFSVQYPSLGFAAGDGNFRHIYLNPNLRDKFFLFLENVFHLYPEDELHKLIFKHSQNLTSDKEIYRAILHDLPEIKPVLGQIRYALPSLRKQKQVMCDQTIRLLDGQKVFKRYMEIGSTGRYYDQLRHRVKFRKRPIFINDKGPSYSPSDVFERGHILKTGDFVPLYDYAQISREDVKDESVDLLSVYIGFHHAQPDKRDDFIDSCYRVMAKGGVLIVRDHDVDSEDMTHFVALAHDVFNAGFELPWETNDSEIRNFTSIAQLEALLIAKGFQKDDRRLLQDGDPTRNTLIRFTKV